MMIDTHAHLTIGALSADPAGVWQRAQHAGVSNAWLIATSLETSRQNLELSEQLPGVVAAVGIHPEELATIPPQDANTTLLAWKTALAEMVQDPRCTLIGECGLDYVALQSQDRAVQEQARTLQRRLFLFHCELAKTTNKVLSIHCRNTRKPDDPSTLDAYHDLLDTLRHASTSDGVYPRFVLHCMSGSIEYAKDALAMGGYLSFAGNVTYPNAAEIQAILQITPLDRLLLETDCPFLSPQPVRGQPNEPAFVAYTYAYVAKARGVLEEKLRKQVLDNANTLVRSV